MCQEICGVGGHRLESGHYTRKSVQREREQNEKTAREWIERKYSSISCYVKNIGYTIYWEDGTGISTRETFMRGYALKGKTPCIDVTSVVSC